MSTLRVYGSKTLTIFLGALALAVLVPILVRATVSFHLYADAHDAEPKQAAIVLGASIVRGEPSAILTQRLDTAIELYRAGKVRKILVSGDNGESNYDEVSAMLSYLEHNAIPSRDVFYDKAGFDTYSSMYRARHVFGARQVIVVTQDFHLPRAVFLARIMGLDADGVVAGNGGTGWDYLREIPATLKALWDLAVGRQPKYLGAPIPLAGKGNAAS